MFFQGNYQSEVLRRKKGFVVVMPDKVNKETAVLVLLHGVGSDELDWTLNTPLVRYANEYNTAFFCPAAENSFYTDHADGENYGQALGEEFLDVMSQRFALDFHRENVSIAGFSMGGYGAVLLGLRFANRYHRIGGFSPAFIFYKKDRADDLYRQVFSKGDTSSENDCLIRYKEVLLSGKPLPEIQLTCGTEDPLLAPTEEFIRAVGKLDPLAAIEWFTQPGFHDYGLWEQDLLRFLKTT